MLPVLSFLPTTALFSLSSPWRCVKSWTLPIPRKPPGLDQLYGVCVCTPDCLHLQHASCPILFPEAGRCAAVHQWIILLQNYTVLRPECARHENISASSCNLPWTESGFRPGLNTWKHTLKTMNVQKRVQIWFQTSNKVCITGTILTLRTRREVLSQLEKIIIQTALLKSPFWLNLFIYFFYTFISIKP